MCSACRFCLPVYFDLLPLGIDKSFKLETLLEGRLDGAASKARLGVSGLFSEPGPIRLLSEQDDEQDNHQDQSQSAARVIAPITAVRPSWQGPNQEQD